MSQLGGLWQGSAAARPRNIYSGFHRDTFTQGLPKNEFSLGTHQAGRVPTWSLHNTHGVADSCTHSLPKNEFSQNTHLPCRVPKCSLYITLGSHPCSWPQSLATKPCRKPRKFVTHMVHLYYQWGRRLLYPQSP